MIYLLDTHILVWAITAPEKLTGHARDILTDKKNTIIISAISFWEISLKFALGKLKLKNMLPEDFLTISEKMGFLLLPLNAEDTVGFYRLTGNYHKDPFDRMLIWQAFQHHYTLISDDKMIKKYAASGLKVIS